MSSVLPHLFRLLIARLGLLLVSGDKALHCVGVVTWAGRSQFKLGLGVLS